MNKTRILLVEDEKDARDILEFYLKTLFDIVDVAKDGDEGYKIFKNEFDKANHYDLIVTDIKMPKIDGLTMVEEITRLNSNQKYIIVSAYKDEDYLLRAISLNIAGYFVKPLDIDKMIVLLKKIKKESLSESKEDKYIIILNKTYKYNKKTNMLYDNNKSIKLSKKESLLIKALISNLNNIISNEELKKTIWKNKIVSDSTLRTTMKRVKDKIIDDDFILSRKGLGYQIEKIQ